jgi:integrase
MKALLYAVILLALTAIHPGIMLVVALCFLVANRIGAGKARKVVTTTARPAIPTRAAELGVVKQVPRVKGLRPEEVEFEFLDFEEADRVVTAADPEWRAFIFAGLRTGLRVGELLALRWEDVDLKAARITIRRTLWNGQEGSPKGGKARRVDLGEEVLATLKAHRHLRPTSDHPDGRRSPQRSEGRRCAPAARLGWRSGTTRIGTPSPHTW